MKFPVSVVRSFEDIQLNFEAIVKAFLRVVGARAEDNLVTVRGLVLGSATIDNGAGFTVARSPAGFANGDYTVTFSPVFSQIPAVVVSPYYNAGDVSHRVAALTAGLVRVIVYDLAGVEVDSNFSFIAIGSS